MKENTWNYIQAFIHSALKTARPELDEESIEAVQHYLDHDEYEMAFEGLFIEIMKLQNVPEINFRESREVAKLLNLHKESVFDTDFWSKFDDFTERKTEPKL